MNKVNSQHELDQLKERLDKQILESQDSENSELIYLVKDDADLVEVSELIQSIYSYGETGSGETAVLVKNNKGEYRFALGG
ncbi:hypothetical protein [Pedobacter rhizosphaerae]|uniref:Uncharacterized protein n=1 Tax=Pedobacter rhizosphaerae TaxID=390241 RepID=A0A1H9TJM4_9SPHI|nr:hypothetical protein [Pedobacter rhizosphaerae]SER96793.1 hypothetical protein SAMN04488023_1235 [Pedobacter rhizosphaerae]